MTGTVMEIGMMNRYEFFTGKIDDVSIYNRALTNEEILSLYWRDN